MILVDTSVWVDHLKTGLSTLAKMLDRGLVVGHPWVTGELVLGRLRGREEIIGLLDGLPRATVATPAEVLALIDGHELYGAGIGYVDAQLLAAARLTPSTVLWTEDRRLAAAAVQLDVAFATRE